MAYASSGLIQATDYNNYAWGGTQGVYTASPNNLAYVLGVGNGALGYGQDVSAINTVAASNLVTATQWSGFLTGLNKCLGHQSGAGAQLSEPTIIAGGTITYSAAIASAVTTINTNAALYTAQGSTTTGTWSNTAVSSTTGLSNAVYGTRTVTFSSANAARYFFNSGGQLNYIIGTNSSNGSGASNSVGRLVTGIGGVGQRNTTNTGRFGTGITLNTNNTNFGYRNNVLNSPTTIIQVTDTTSGYGGSIGYCQVSTSSSDTTNGSNGLNVIFRTLLTVSDKTWDDTISINFGARVDIVYPETTFLVSAWGTPSVA